MGPGSGAGPSRASGWIGASVGLALILALLLPTAGAGPVAAPFTVSITANSTTGDAPLLVTFGLSVSAGIPTGADWSFGDGTYLNATGSGAFTPVHPYLTPGGYPVHVEVWEGGVASNATTSVVVRPPPVRVAVLASPLSGPTPLSVTFTASVTGGTPPTGAVMWRFGDGYFGSGDNVTHVFTAVGVYLVQATVSDANGSMGNGSLYVAALANSTGPPPTPADPYLGYGIAVGLGAIALAGLLLARQGRRSIPSPPAGTYGGFEGAPPTLEPETPAAVEGAPLGGPAGPLSLDPNASGGGEGPPGGGAPPSPVPPPSLPPSRPDPRRVTQEVVDFLYQLGRISPDDIPTTEWTQQGMGERLAIPQNALSNVLGRLEAAGIVTTRVEHVHGRPRRVKTYYLTPAGERLARSRRRGPRPAAPAGGGGRT